MPNDLFARLPMSEPAASEAELASGAEQLRPERARRPDPGTRRLALIAGGIGAALLLVVGAWSLGGRGGGVVPVVDAPSTPMRVRPENRGGMQVAGINDPILSGDLGEGEAALAPPPETPKPSALRTQIEAEKAKLASRTRPRHAEKAEHAPVPAAKPPAASERAAPPKTAVPTASEPTHAREKAAPATQRPERAVAPPAAAGEAGVQLAALKSETAAKTEWERMVKRMPELLAGRRPLFVRAEHDGHAFWRLRMGGFADQAKAREFCAKVRAKGGECLVSTF